MKIQILGPGCANCKKLYEQAEKALKQAGLEAQLEKIEKFEEIRTIRRAVHSGSHRQREVKSAGRIPETPEIVTWVDRRGGQGVIACVGRMGNPPVQ